MDYKFWRKMIKSKGQVAFSKKGFSSVISVISVVKIRYSLLVAADVIAVVIV